MIRLSFFLFLMFVGEVGEPFFEAPKVYPSKPKSHHFLNVYNHIRENSEGNYVYHPADKGGETYGGIARRIHPSWYGWTHVDAAKPLKRHDRVEAAEVWVLDFYLDLWVKEGFENIEDYNLALNLFDFRIHSSPRTVELFTNRVLTKMGCEPTRFGENWIDDRFNQVEPVEFALRLKIQRILLFNQLVRKDESQKVFYKGWAKRVTQDI